MVAKTNAASIHHVNTSVIPPEVKPFRWQIAPFPELSELAKYA
ncbi:MAG TPA: hypothetical protein VFG10_09670 [Saprospiraceae bacterium]|nr:hypothetical protein [Saprospiraceae bacterium]